MLKIIGRKETMKLQKQLNPFKRLVALLLCVLCAAGSVPGQAADGLDGLPDALKNAASLDEQLALLYDASVTHADMFETGGWQVDLNEPAAGGQEWVPAEDAYDAAEEVDSLPEQFKNRRLIALYDNDEKARLAGDLYVRLPEPMRARSTQEAEGVLIFRHYLTERSDYTGSAYNRHYALYARLFDSDVLYCLYHDYTTPPLMGRGTLRGVTIAASQLWEKMRPLFYDRLLTVETAEGPLYFRVTGRTCSLCNVEGDREVLDVPAEVEGYPVTSLTFSYIYDVMPSLREVHLPEGLVSIGRYAFGFCEKLGTINFPSTLRSIGDGAFAKTALEEIALNEGLETIGDYAFSGEKALRSITLPSTVKIYSRRFLQEGGNLPYLIIPEGAERLEDSFLEDANRMLCVYIPQTVTYFGSDLLADGTIRIYTPEGSPAARWAESEGYGYTPCPSPDDMPRPAYITEGDFDYAVLEGEAILMRYLGKGGDVTVPDSLGGCPVKRVIAYAFEEYKDLTVYFPACLAEIDTYAVYNCDGVHVYIPGSETALTNYSSISSSDNAVVHAPEGSLAHQWCMENEREWVAWTPEP
jgi:hypothetical protein